MRRLIAVVGTIAVLGLTALPGSAGAMATHTTPNGYVGAMNMLQDPTMLTVAMVHDDANGNAGMFLATCVSAGQFC